MRRLFLLCCLLLFFFTCTKEYDNPIPVCRVYLEVDLTFRDKELLAIASSKIFTSNNTIHGKEFPGFAGVLVTYSIFDGYKSFDIGCPNEVRRDAVVEIDADNNAVCKVCGSKYEVMTMYGSGMPIEGPSKYPLRPYRTMLRDKTLTVRN